MVIAFWQSLAAFCIARAETATLPKNEFIIKHMRALLFDLQRRQEQKTWINSHLGLPRWFMISAALFGDDGIDTIGNNELTNTTMSNFQSCFRDITIL